MARRQQDISKGTEFGGVNGMIQPLPHEPNASETLNLIYHTEPDPAYRPEHDLDDVVPATRRVR